MSEFVYVSGRHCLDFVGTVLWRRAGRIDLLKEPDDLRRWGREAGLLGDMTQPSPADLSDAISLREALYTTITAAIANEPPRSTADVDLINARASHPLPALTLTRRGTTRSSGTFENLASLVARDAIDLIGGSDLQKVKECANPECTRLFVDLSRAQSRRWCGMSECGNRAKAAEYRRRKRAHQ